MARAVQEAAKPKFRGNKALKSKVVSHYPDNVAREYTRVVNAYMAMFNKVLKEYMPIIRYSISIRGCDPIEPFLLHGDVREPGVCVFDTCEGSVFEKIG